MTNEKAFEKFILSDDWQEIRLHAQNSDELAENVWEAAISYMQEQDKFAEQSEPVAWVSPKTAEYFGVEGRYKVSVFRYGKFDDYIIPLYTTPQRQQPLKRLDEDVVDEIFNSYSDEQGYVVIDDWHLLANAIQDKMQEINRE